MPDDLMFAEADETKATEGGMRERVIDALRTVYDPEIPVNIWEMGLIYKVDVKDEELPLMVEEAALEVEGVKSAAVEVVWEPSWNPGMMSEVAKLELGMF